jgi:hypothetical protein
MRSAVPTATRNGARGQDDDQARVSAAGAAAATWGLVGVAALLLRAIWRLAPIARQAFTGPPLRPTAWVIAAGWLAFMAYFEGYQGFQRGFAPRVVVRAVHLAAHPRPLHALLAPLYCMGLVHATRRRMITGWSVVTGIIALVLAVSRVAQPSRGIVDAGVVLGLAWGLAAIVVFAVRALLGAPPRAAADLPAT